MSAQLRSTGEHWTALPDPLINDPKISQRAKLVYWKLKSHVGKGVNTAFPRVDTIATALAMSKTTVMRAIKELVEKGWIERERRTNEYGERLSNLYTIHWKPKKPKCHESTKVVAGEYEGSSRRVPEVEPGINRTREEETAPADSIKAGEDGDGEGEDRPFTERLAEMYSEKYDVYLGLNDTDATKAAQLIKEHGTDAYLAAFRTYLDDDGKDGGLRKIRHRVATFHRQFAEWKEKAKNATQEEAERRRREERDQRQRALQRQADWYIGAVAWAGQFLDEERTWLDAVNYAIDDDASEEVATLAQHKLRPWEQERFSAMAKEHADEYHTFAKPFYEKARKDQESLEAMMAKWRKPSQEKTRETEPVTA